MTEQEHVDLQKQIGAVDAKCERILGLLKGGQPTCADHSKRLDRIERAMFGIVAGMLGLFAKVIFWGKS
jgi:hypothetical protein